QGHLRTTSRGCCSRSCSAVGDGRSLCPFRKPGTFGCSGGPAHWRGGGLTLCVLGALTILAVACASYFGVRLLQVERTAAALTPPAAWTPELQELWVPLPAPDPPLRVVLRPPSARNHGPPWLRRTAHWWSC